MRNPIVDKGFSVRGVAQTQNKHLFLAEMVLQDWLPTSVLVSARILKAFVYSLVETQMCPNYKIINLPQRRTWPKCWTFFSKPPDLFQAVVQAGFWFRSCLLPCTVPGKGREVRRGCCVFWDELFFSVLLSREILIPVLPLQLLSPFVLLLPRCSKLSSGFGAVAWHVKCASSASGKERQVLGLQG